MCSQQHGESSYFLKLCSPLSSHLHRSDLPPSSSLHPFFPLHISSPSSNPLLVPPPTPPPTYTSACVCTLLAGNLCTCQSLSLHSLPASPPPVFCPHRVKSASAPSLLSAHGRPNWIFLTFLELIHSKQKEKKLLAQTNFADEKVVPSVFQPAAGHRDQ